MDHDINVGRSFVAAIHVGGECCARLSDFEAGAVSRGRSIIERVNRRTELNVNRV